MATSTDRTNVTDTGYTYNGQNYTTQSKVDSQGNSYSVDMPTSSNIPVSQIAGATPMKVAAPIYDASGLMNTGTTANAYTQSAFDTATADVDALNKQAQDASSSKSSLELLLGNKTEDTVNQYNTKDETGNSVNTLAAQLRSYNAQSQALGLDNQAKTLEEVNKATGQNITSSAVQRNTADATRENTIKIARIAMQSAIAKADYDTAKSFADQIISAKYDKITAEIAAKQTNLDALDKYKLTPAEQKRKDAQTALLAKQAQDVADKKATETANNAVYMKVLEAGTATPEVKSAIADAIKNGKSTGEVLALAGNSLAKPNEEVIKMKNANGDEVAYIYDKNTGKVRALSFGGSSSSGSTGLPQNSPLNGVVSTILGSGKFTVQQSNAIRNAIANGEDPSTVIKNNAKNIMGQTEATKLTNAESVQSAMKDLKNSIQAYYDAGGETGLIKGTFEKTVNNLGQVKDPKLAQMAVEVQSQLQMYRNAISGTAYSDQEGKDIASVFPGINKSRTLNDSIFAGRDKALQSQIDGLYKSALGEKAYTSIQEASKPKVVSKGNLDDKSFVEKALSSRNINYEKAVNDTPKGQIPVLLNSTGEQGYVPIGEYNAGLYTKL